MSNDSIIVICLMFAFIFIILASAICDRLKTIGSEIADLKDSYGHEPDKNPKIKLCHVCEGECEVKIIGKNRVCAMCDGKGMIKYYE